MIHNCKIPKIQDCIFFVSKIPNKQNICIFAVAKVSESPITRWRMKRECSENLRQYPLLWVPAPNMGRKRFYNLCHWPQGWEGVKPEQVRRPADAFIRFATCGCTGENQNSDFPLHPAFRSNTRLPTALRKVWIRFEFLLCRIPQGYGWFFICQT